MKKHHYFEDNTHYANFIRSVLRGYGIGMDETIYETLKTAFKIAQEFGIFADTDEFSWSVREIVASSEDKEKDFDEIKKLHREMIKNISEYRILIGDEK
jgi:hypothetical protein